MNSPTITKGNKDKLAAAADAAAVVVSITKSDSSRQECAERSVESHVRRQDGRRRPKRNSESKHSSWTKSVREGAACTRRSMGNAPRRLIKHAVEHILHTLHEIHRNRTHLPAA